MPKEVERHMLGVRQRGRHLFSLDTLPSQPRQSVLRIMELGTVSWRKGGD